MQEFVVAIGVGCVVFFVFILVFLRKDRHGTRGARLAGCNHHGGQDQCERCREAAPATILPRPPDADKP